MTFVDLFSGLGAFHFASEALGDMKCVMAADIDANAIKIYNHFHSQDSSCDLTKVETKDIPDCDFVFGGSPCQSFSMAGNREGLADTRGTLFFDYARIVEDKQPKCFVFENVKGLVNHDDGKTFKIMTDTFKQIGYNIFHQILDAKDYGGACYRPRIFVVGFRKDLGITEFTFPAMAATSRKVYDLLELDVDDAFYMKGVNILKHLDEFLKSTTLCGHPVLQYRRHYFRMYDNICPTLTANMGSGGHNVPFVKGARGWRKLTPLECFKVMGFDVVLPSINNSGLYKLIGNSISLDVLNCLMPVVVDAVR